MTTAGTSARRSARRSGSIEPVIEGPLPSALFSTFSRSSGDTRIGATTALSAASLAPDLQPGKASSARRQRGNAKRLAVLNLVTTSSFENSVYDDRAAPRVACRTSGFVCSGEYLW